MKKNLKIKSLMAIIAFLSLTIIISNIFDDHDYNFKNTLEISGFWDLTSTPIYINDLNPSFNWSKTAAENEWCSGSGTWGDPYLIENITIDDLFSGSCIWIENSEVPFIIRNCTFINSGRGAIWPDSGIRFNNVSNGYVENNTIYLNEFHGLSILDGSNNNTITKNKINNNDAGGVYLGYSSNNNTFSENIFNYNWDGAFYIYECDSNNFIGNNFTQTSSDITQEISITGYNHSFSGNNFIDCGIYLRDDKPLSELSSHLIDKSNLVNNKPIYYYAEKQFLMRDNFTNAGQVILVDCEYCEISDVNISNGGRGISLYYSNNNTIFNNNVSNSFVAEIFIYKSHQNNVSHNSISNLDSSRGINLRYSNENNITFNQIKDCNTAIEVSTSFNNIISDNHLDKSYRGMYIQNGQIVEMFNVITRNIISNNSEGIYVTSPYTTNNTIHLNYFINNGVNAENNGGSNNWDNGLIGNYWDDYIGTDTNDDGVGETPRIIPGTAGDQDNLPIYDDGHNGSKIVIDDSSSNNWNWASKFTWCSGSGTFKDPYIIKECTINGQNSGSCIIIKNSNAFFRIENCNVFNSSSDIFNYAGIVLENTFNGVLINNNCSNNGNGITLFGCINITIQDCDCENNNWAGITLISASQDNFVIHNDIKGNYRGIELYTSCTNNQIIDNTLEDNSNRGIRVSAANFNIIKRNYVFNSFYGIMLNGDNNTLSLNEIYSCYNGIYAGGGTYNNTIANNTIHYNGWGIYFEHAFCQNMLIYNNSFIGNGIHAHDNGGLNNWDNGLIGNYWDNYTGSDADDDGIGEDPYIYIQGLAFSQDNFPIWDDGHNGSKIAIDDSASNNWDWAKTRIWCTGSGTFNDPYIIKDCIIDGKNLTSCIEISNSMVYFRIENCIVINSSSGLGLDNAGIKLIDVSNGQLVANNCSNNKGNGIYLSNSENNTISGNIANKNNEFGILLAVSHNNNLSGNIFNENYYGGIYLGLSTTNNISENAALNNDQRGIYLSSSSNNNTILNNNLSYNEEGIFISDSYNNTVIGNNADHNDYGIWVWESNNNIIIGNNVSYNDLIGLWLYRSNNTDVIRNIFIGNLYKNIDEDESINNNFKWNYLDGVFSPFIIDDNGGGDFTWFEAKILFFWCTGSGTYSDPYLINHLIIDGKNSSSCIEIRDSMVFFKIEGCTLSNSSLGLYNAGVKLVDVMNGQLIDNDCSNNNGVGIGLYQSHNITIDGNIVNNNIAFGIFLEGSHNNILSGNTLNENSDGVYLGLSTNNTISENSAFNNDLRGIYISSLSNENTIVSNNVTYNGDNGIDIYDCHNIKVLGNIANNNGWNGVFLWECNDTTVVRNIANYNTFAGLYLWSSNNTEVVGNIFIGNLYSIYESNSENYIFNWNVDNGFTTSIIIDDSGAGDFTWVESVNQLAWIYGSGTLIDPYIIELITINGLNLTSCLIIRNSNVYFRVQNCTFHNSSNDLYDGGIKLTSASNGELIYNNCSFNNANGIVLDSCQNIMITENTINNNEMSGISVISSNNIDIINNKETINYNGQYGILLDNSDNNEISNNLINFNQIGIYLINSNDNLIAYNDLQYNILEAIHIESGEGNILEGNLLPREPAVFPFEILIIILIIGIVAIGITGSVLIIKKRISFSGLKEKKEVSEKKKEKIRSKLEEKLHFVDYLIRERNIKLAYKNLGKIKDTADQHDFHDIFNRASEKVEICKEIEKVPESVIKEEVSTTKKERKMKEVIVAPPIIKKEEEKKYNLFISYSTLDRDYFQIEKIVKKLKAYPNIPKVSYWERDSKANIVEFMDETLELSTTFLLFCSENSMKSKAVKDEWQAAFQMRKEGLIKLIPIYKEQKHIPKILWHLLNVKYDKDDFKGFIENVYKEILRE